jgi:hypothetical protein
MAARVTDRLWEIGGGFYVKATLPNSLPENISGFTTENEALLWVRNDSVAWLQARRSSLEKKVA